MTDDDVLMAFFPCTRFEAKIPLAFRGDAYQQQKWTDKQKLEYAIELHKELHRNYLLISWLVIIALDRGLKLIIENPYTKPHYLTTYWCIKPKIIDKDRTDRGDYYKKPTQFFFINAEPCNNIIMEMLEPTEFRTIESVKAKDGKSRETIRSEIHPQYANRFIREHILDRDLWDR